MMYLYLDHLYRSATDLGMLINVTTTCVLMIYLLFQMSKLIDRILIGNRNIKTIIRPVEGELLETEIQIGSTVIQIDYQKVKRLFWKSIGLAYLIGFGLGLAILLIIPIIVYLVIKKIFRSGISKFPLLQSRS